MTLLRAGDPDPVGVVNPHGRSRFVLIGDHAGVAVPAALYRLGLSDEAFARHIAVDLGIQTLGEALAERLDAAFVHQRYSRLVIDCNRDPERADAMPEVSDGTPIPGNHALSAADRLARVAAIHEPYQQAIAKSLAARGSAILVSLHSFTPRMNGVDRPWQVGVLHDCGDTRFSHALLAALREDTALTVGDNEPYRMADTDHTVPRHAYPNRPYAEIEVRQDLLDSDAGVRDWADRLTTALQAIDVGDEDERSTA